MLYQDGLGASDQDVGKLPPRKINEWGLPCDSLSQFSGVCESWHRRWMPAGFCWQWLLAMEERAIYLMLVKRMSSKRMNKRSSLPALDGS